MVCVPNRSIFRGVNLSGTNTILHEGAKRIRPKTLRSFFYAMAGRVVHHARRLILRVDDGIGARWLKEAWGRLDALSFSFG